MKHSRQNDFEQQRFLLILTPLQIQGMRRPGAAAAAGRAPSIGSTVSNGSVAIFGRTNPRTLEEIQENEVLVRKDQRGAQGSKIFIAHRTSATMALAPKFLGSQHLQSRNADGENVQKATKLQEQFVSNLEVMAMFVVRMKQYDLSIPLQIPKEYFDVVNVEDRWDMNNPSREIIDLSTQWGRCNNSFHLGGSSEFRRRRRNNLLRC